jgi:hypothetical protein
MLEFNSWGAFWDEIGISVVIGIGCCWKHPIIFIPSFNLFNTLA